jgi:hypothetical protein
MDFHQTEGMILPHMKEEDKVNLKEFMQQLQFRY